MIYTTGIIKEREIWNEREVLFWIDVPDVCATAKPGQFVMVGLEGGGTYLKKAISIHGVKNNLLGIAIQGVGSGTEQLISLPVDAKISLIGPLGNGFDTNIFGEKIMLVAGGIGKAPFRWLAEVLSAQNNEVIVVCGGRRSDDVAGMDWVDKVPNAYLRLATESGEVGSQGFVTTLMEDLSEMARIYVCGPSSMLKVVQQMALSVKVPCQLSLEGKMACGVGVCLGCTCRRSDETKPYAKVCHDGPVFWSEEVVLDD